MNDTNVSKNASGEPLKGEGSALDIANAAEREIQLAGRQDPTHFKMPDGRTLAETRQELFEAHTKEGIEATKTQLKRVREQSMQSDPIYAEGATVVMRDGAASILPEASKALPSPVGGDLKTSSDEEVEHSGDVTGLTATHPE